MSTLKLALQHHLFTNDSATYRNYLQHLAERADIDREVISLGNLRLVLSAKLQNLQTPRRAITVAHKHYDLSTELYRAMLDKRMIYSCGYWKSASNLDEAQEAKLSLVCRKLGLEPGMRLLDIGCGWGGAARYAAENFDVRVTGITVSEEQRRMAEKPARDCPLISWSLTIARWMASSIASCPLACLNT